MVAPSTRGFGTRLTESVLAFEVQARAELRFEPDGAVCVFAAPLIAVRAVGEVGS
ncbi:hypothetical protein [Salinarimonas sp.]|uniref:hypothetical protein n=1 Tax=Salinarimonas sp. TaxID=2766526 RepID=UPI0032D8C353